MNKLNKQYFETKKKHKEGLKKRKLTFKRAAINSILTLLLIWGSSILQKSCKQRIEENERKELQIESNKKIKMNFKITTILIITIISLFGCKQRDYISDYNKYLDINLPNDMMHVKINENVNVFDYSNEFIYRLTNLQKSNLIEDIYFKVGDSTKKDCWKKHGDYYSFEISDSTLMSGYYIKAVLTGNDINTLIIKEMKWK